MPNPNANPNANRRNVDPEVYEAALNDFLTALEIDPETAFSVDVSPHQTHVKHAKYSKKDNGVMSGDFWEDVVSRENPHRPND